MATPYASFPRPCCNSINNSQSAEAHRMQARLSISSNGTTRAQTYTTSAPKARPASTAKVRIMSAVIVHIPAVSTTPTRLQAVRSRSAKCILGAAHRTSRTGRSPVTRGVSRDKMAHLGHPCISMKLLPLCISRRLLPIQISLWHQTVTRNVWLRLQ